LHYCSSHTRGEIIIPADLRIPADVNASRKFPEETLPEVANDQTLAGFFIPRQTLDLEEKLALCC
jgi:hypothetical protein